MDGEDAGPHQRLSLLRTNYYNQWFLKIRKNGWGKNFLTRMEIWVRTSTSYFRQKRSEVHPIDDLS